MIRQSLTHASAIYSPPVYKFSRIRMEIIFLTEGNSVASVCNFIFSLKDVFLHTYGNLFPSWRKLMPIKNQDNALRYPDL